MERCASAEDKVWARTRIFEQEERHVLSAHTLSAREQPISERARPVLCKSKGNPRASREIRAQAGRFALAHYINLLSRYQNALSTFGSKITPCHLILQTAARRILSQIRQVIWGWGDVTSAARILCWQCAEEVRNTCQSLLFISWLQASSHFSAEAGLFCVINKPTEAKNVYTLRVPALSLPCFLICCYNEILDLLLYSYQYANVLLRSFQKEKMKWYTGTTSH